jgi:Na+-translocating ferredoxin:NAD+ oxidoreductase RNF subunit RnfB
MRACKMDACLFKGERMSRMIPAQNLECDVPVKGGTEHLIIEIDEDAEYQDILTLIPNVE